MVHMIPFPKWKNDARSWVRGMANGPVCVIITTDNPLAAYRTEVRNPLTGERGFLSYVHTATYPKSTVYFLASPTHIKVGCSVNVIQRQRELSCSSTRIQRPATGDTFNLTLLGTLPECGYKAESSAKRMLKAYRDVGEWFFNAPEVIEIIRSMPKFVEAKQ